MMNATAATPASGATIAITCSQDSSIPPSFRGGCFPPAVARRLLGEGGHASQMAASVLVVVVPVRFRPALAEVVDRLAALDYQGLKRDGIDPLPDSDLSMWIRNYGDAGATVVPLPDEAWAEAEAWPVDARPGEWWVVLPLWTREEGMSDLSLEATATESPGKVVVVINDIHVL